jgi:thiol-disulfide isomerase/thioredoxin
MEVAGAPAVLVAFICNHCPFVIHIKDEFSKLAADYEGKGLWVLAISANDVEKYPQDAPDKMADFAEEAGFVFPYLYDETQEVAKAYMAACTPDFFLFDRDLKLAYRGQFDDSRPESGRPVTGKDLRAAVDALLAGEEPSQDQRPSIGCNIKWKEGNAPDYFG